MPLVPPMKHTGMNTAMNTNVEVIKADVMLLMALTVA